MAVMPISALVLPYILLDEAPRWWHGIGLAHVVAATGPVTWDRLRK